MPIKPKKIKFKMPKETPTERAHRLHQQIRKKSGLPDPEEYKRRAAEKQKEIDALKEADTFPVGHDGQSIKKTADSQKKSAESRAKAMGTAAANRSKMAAIKDIVKEPERDVREETHYVKVNNAIKTTPSGAHIMKFPDRESAERHAAEHKRRNPNHHVTVTTNANDSTPVWHAGTKLRPYTMREGMEMELEEAIKLGSKVQIHAPGKSYHGKTGHVGEIRNGAFKGAPKTYTVDHGDGSVQLSQKNVKLHTEEVEQVDEISANLAGNYLDKVKAKHGTNYNDLPKKRQRGVVNALDIKMNAADKKIKEEVELDESIKDHIEQSMAAKDINAKVEGDKVHVHPENLSKARYMLDKMGLKHSVHGTLKDSVEHCHWEIITEGWSQGKRNPQRGIKVGDKVRSYDFPGMHDDHYVEGHVVRDTPTSYHLRVNKVVRSGKEIPVPAHMAHVEAPKGKGLFSDAYGVHKIMAKQQSVSAVQEPIRGAQKTFKDVRGKQ